MVKCRRLPTRGFSLSAKRYNALQQSRSPHCNSVACGQWGILGLTFRGPSLDRGTASPSAAHCSSVPRCQRLHPLMIRGGGRIPIEVHVYTVRLDTPSRSATCWTFSSWLFIFHLLAFFFLDFVR